MATRSIKEDKIKINLKSLGEENYKHTNINFIGIFNSKPVIIGGNTKISKTECHSKVFWKIRQSFLWRISGLYGSLCGLPFNAIFGVIEILLTRGPELLSRKQKL